jgi:hypothetical protein
MSKKITFGVMCSGYNLRRWEADCIKKLLEHDQIQLKLVLFDVPENYKRKGFLKKVLSVKPKHLFFLIYSKFILRPLSTRLVDLTEVLIDIPFIKCKVNYEGKYSQCFSEEDINKIKEHKLDFILRFGFNIIRGEILESAKYGVWSFHHDDEEKYRGAPPCFWEIYNSDFVTGSILQRLTGRLDGGVVLKKGYFRTKMHSYKKNIDQAYFSSSKWPYYVCKDIINSNAPYLEGASSLTKAPIYKYPNNKQLLFFIIKTYYHSILKTINYLFVKDVWNVALVFHPIGSFLVEKNFRYKFIGGKSVAGFIADPFGFIKQGKIFIFLEELVFKKRSAGRISMFTLSEKGDVLKKETLLDSGGHLSYPFVIKDQNKIYILPESSKDCSLNMYELAVDKNRLDLKYNLVEGKNIVDPTLIVFNNKFWLFYTISDGEYDPDVHLHISYSDHLSGPYSEHKKNPVKIDARSSRPAGTPFIHENILYRPSQNFSKTYGGSVVINKIIKLTEEDFEEEPIKEIFPFDTYYKDGIHTISCVSDELTVIDSKRKVYSFDRLKNLF